MFDLKKDEQLHELLVSCIRETWRDDYGHFFFVHNNEEIDIDIHLNKQTFRVYFHTSSHSHEANIIASQILTILIQKIKNHARYRVKFALKEYQFDFEENFIQDVETYLSCLEPSFVSNFHENVKKWLEIHTKKHKCAKDPARVLSFKRKDGYLLAKFLEKQKFGTIIKKENNYDTRFCLHDSDLSKNQPFLNAFETFLSQFYLTMEQLPSYDLTYDF